MRKFLLFLLVALSLVGVASAGLTRYPDGVSSFGMPIIGSGDLLTTGTTFFVSSSDTKVGSDANNGETPDQPFKTVSAAVTIAAEGRGDLILVMAGHKEVVATSDLALNTAGIRVVGLGLGDYRPQITIGNSGIGADINVTSADVSVENIIFIAGIDSLTNAFDVRADGFTMAGCEFRGTATNQVDRWIMVTNNISRFNFSDNKVRQTTAGGASFLEVGISYAWDTTGGGELEDHYIGSNDIVGDFSISAINNGVTANDILVEYNTIDNLNASDACISVNALTDGTLRYNTLRIATDAIGTWITPTPNDVQLYENYGVNGDAETGVLIGTPSQ